jgi:general stress protein 26
MASLEEVSQYALDEAQREELLAKQRVCSVCWTTSEGWPVGVTHRYIWERGRIWVTTSSQRHRVRALGVRPQSCVIISGDGTDLGPDRTLTLKTLCKIHDDTATREWFYTAFAKALNPNDEIAQQAMVDMLDSPRRVILELEPVKAISYDGMKLALAIATEGIAN